MRRGLTSLAIFAAFVIIITLSRHVIDPTSSTTTTGVPITTTTSVAETTTTTTVATTTTCQGSDFTGVYNEGEGAAGTVYASVTLTKHSAGTCSVKGWPILTLQNKSGAILGLTAVNESGISNAIQFLTTKANEPPSTLSLTNGSAANFSIAYSSVSTANTICENATTISVQFASGASSVPVTPAYPVQPCDNGKVWISPFY